MADDIEFYLLDIKTRVANGRTDIVLFGRTADGSRIAFHDMDYVPNFYAVPYKDSEELRGSVRALKIDDEKRKGHVVSMDIQKLDHEGTQKTVYRIDADAPSSVSALADELKGWEDIDSVHSHEFPIIRKYIIEKGIVPFSKHIAKADALKARDGMVEARLLGISLGEGDLIDDIDIMAFDIETYNRGFMPVADEDPIIMIALYSKKMSRVITWKRFATEREDVEFVKDEPTMIRRFAELVKEFKPDIITGYNSDGFDFPYIRDRARKHKIRLDVGLDGSEVSFGRGNNPSATVTGIIHIDLFQFVRRMMRDTLKIDSLKLDSVAAEVIGERKLVVDMEQMAKDWDSGKNLEKYVDYNLHDSKITHELCIRFLPNIIEFTKLSSIPPDELIRMGYSQIVEGYLLKLAHRQGVVPPNRPGFNAIKARRKESYLGGFVFEPTPGLYHDLAVFDFKSLYPTIISSHNIDPYTLDCDCCRGEAKPVPAEKSSDEHHHFCTKRRGFIPSIIEDVIERRIRIKEMLKSGNDRKEKKSEEDISSESMLNARQYSLKIMANSIYGYLAFFGSRWYSIECARSITAYARDYIKDVIAKAGEVGFGVIYSDTDSVFLTLNGKSEDESIAFCKEINTKLPGIMELQLEGFFSSGIFVSAKADDSGAKKKYALLGKDGKLKITGFETIRRNWSQISKDIQEDILRLLLETGDTEKALKHTKDVIGMLKRHEIDNEKLILKTQITMKLDDYEAIGPHVAAARRMQERGQNVAPGTIVSYIICQGSGIIRDRAKLPDECASNSYDSDYYINNQVIPAVEMIFKVFGISKDEITEAGRQKGLGEWV